MKLFQKSTTFNKYFNNLSCNIFLYSKLLVCCDQVIKIRHHAYMHDALSLTIVLYFLAAACASFSFSSSKLMPRAFAVSSSDNFASLIMRLIPFALLPRVVGLSRLAFFSSKALIQSL